jgi:hypothetical protein
MWLLGQTKKGERNQLQKYLLCFIQSMFIMHKNVLFCMPLSYKTIQRMSYLHDNVLENFLKQCPTWIKMFHFAWQCPEKHFDIVFQNLAWHAEQCRFIYNELKVQICKSFFLLGSYQKGTLSHLQMLQNLHSHNLRATLQLWLYTRWVPPANVSIWLVTRNPSVTHVIFATFINSIIPTSSNPLLNLPEFEGERERERKRGFYCCCCSSGKCLALYPSLISSGFWSRNSIPVCVGGSLSLMWLWIWNQKSGSR